VLPLDDRFAERMDTTLRPGFFTGRKRVTLYPGMTRLPEGSGPKLVGVPFTMTVPIEITNGKAEGVLFALGGDAAGWSLFLWEGKPRFHYNFFGLERYDVTGPTRLSSGKHTLKVMFRPDSPTPGGPASVSLAVDGKVVGRGRIERQVPQRCGTETLDVGMDCVSPVCADYEDRGLFPFTGGNIEKVTFDFTSGGPKVTGMDRLKLATRMD
jgi:arylsulfatase